MGVESRPDPLTAQAAKIVNSAINAKGQATSVLTIHGRAQNFDDLLGETIYGNYLRDAMTEVDDGNWQNADTIARSKAIANTILTLHNQQ